VRTDEPSPLSGDERALLDGFLSFDFEGGEELREQLNHLTAKRGCTCGCGTIDFVLDGAAVPRSDAANPVPVDAIVRDAGDEVGGLILFVKDGLLQSLEIYSHAEALPLPRPDQVTWRG
jgi:hypothetical protein